MSHAALKCTVVAGLVITAALIAGPLNPPAGPVASSYKTLAEVEPRTVLSAVNTPGDADSLFKITQPGSYYLTGNITGVAGRHGIEIAANGVTLDLCGFELAGVPGSLDGIAADALLLAGIAVRNGSVRDWGRRGINLLALSPSDSVVTGVRAARNGLGGIHCASAFSIDDCSAAENGGAGITTGVGGDVTACTAYSNAGDGINTGGVSTIVDCIAYDNDADGISSAAGCTITGCTAYFNAIDGIAAGDGSTVTRCTALGNFANGIQAFEGATITGCTSRANSEDGIRVTRDCAVLGNTCDQQGAGIALGAGVHALEGDNRIDGNTCTDSDTGILASAAGNLIIRNACSGNTVNYDFIGGNRYGPVINITSSATAAVSGNSAADTSGTTHPWANFAY